MRLNGEQMWEKNLTNVLNRASEKISKRTEFRFAVKQSSQYSWRF